MSVFDKLEEVLGKTPTPDPAAPAAPSSPPPSGGQWYCLRSQLNGQFCTAGMFMADGVPFEMAGPVMLFFDREDAEREAVKHRETFPWLLVRAEPLPASPPNVCLPVRHGDQTVIATQVCISRGDQHVTAEIRTQTMTDSAQLAADLLGRIVAIAGSLPQSRVGPIKAVTLGPRPMQITGNTIPSTSDVSVDQEAA